MKINKVKALVGVLATSAVVSLVGSISGTMAWLQYNTRNRVEFQGTSAKCSENLQVRTITGWDTTGDAAVAKVADLTALNALEGSFVDDDVAITDDGKVYTYDDSVPAWGSETAAVDGAKYAVGGRGYAWDATGTAWKEIFDDFGDWKEDLNQFDIADAAAVYGTSTSGEITPVTFPTGTAAGALGTLYSNPICGYEQYATGTYHWDEAKASDYMQFNLQFRVLDIDGKGAAAGKEALLATKLWIRDISIAHVDVTGKADLTSGVRVHLSCGATNMLFGLGDGSANETFDTTTHGYLDLDADGDYDAKEDVPNNYTWTDGADTLLDYGKDHGTATAYNLTKTGDPLALYPADDGKGHLTGGTHLGTTDANESGTAEDTWLTVKVTIFLEGWTVLADQSAPVKGVIKGSGAALPVDSYVVGDLFHNTTDNKIYRCTEVSPALVWAEQDALRNGDLYTVSSARKMWDGDSFETAPTESSVWDASKAIGAKFNIGLSFGVSALD